MVKVPMTKAQVERLQEIASQRGTDLAATFNGLLNEAAAARDLPLVAGMTEAQARALQQIASYDRRGLGDTISALLDGADGTEDSTPKLRNTDDDGRPDFPELTDADEAVADAHDATARAAAEPLPSGKASSSVSPLLKQWARTGRTSEKRGRR